MTTEPHPVTSELAAALRSGKQADTDGVTVIVSRQACEEAADLIDELNRRTPPAGGAERVGLVPQGADEMTARHVLVPVDVLIYTAVVAAMLLTLLLVCIVRANS